MPSPLTRRLNTIRKILVSGDPMGHLALAIKNWHIQSNLRLSEREIRNHACVVKSLPVGLNLDPFPACNLRCPFCPTTTGWSELRHVLLAPEVFQEIVRKFPFQGLVTVYLFNWGEPFINPHLFSYITFFAERGIRTEVHSNLSLREFDASFAEDVVHSGLTVLTASIDGATPESYSKYRVGGDFERVLRNLDAINSAKIRLGSASPRLMYKMLLNRFNEGEVEKAKELATERGAEYWETHNFYIPAELREEWQAASLAETGDITSVEETGRGLIHTECVQMWSMPHIESNGDVFPCCIVCKPEWRVGNILEQTFWEIWNGPKMQTLRRFVTDPESAPPDFPSFCAECSHRYCIHRRVSGQTTVAAPRPPGA